MTMAADRTSSRQTLTPFVGIASGVKDAVDGHGAFDILIENAIREAARQPPAIVRVDKSMHLRGAADHLNACIDAAQKVLSQAESPTLVPSLRLGKVLLGLRRDD
jgi:hypothetical protein